MKFKKEVQELFEKAGWYEGRNVKSVYKKISRFDEYPEFIKEFLYEYGNLKVKTETQFSEAFLDFRILPQQRYDLGSFLDFPRSDFGNELYTFPIAYYHLDVSLLQCDSKGKVYMAGDFPTLVSEDFKTGIEKVLMEDYSNTKEWHPDIQEWKEEQY